MSERVICRETHSEAHFLGGLSRSPRYQAIMLFIRRLICSDSRCTWQFCITKAAIVLQMVTTLPNCSTIFFKNPMRRSHC